jgi:transposase
VAEQRKQWPERLASVPSAKLVFVDESGANTRMVCAVPQGHCQTTTLIAALRLSGPKAPCLFEGAMDGEMFLAWVRKGLAPTLERGDVVILDNLATHKVAGVREAIEAAGARLEYLPPYSPDLNPIENMWSKVKQCLKSRGPRNLRQLFKAAGEGFAAVTPEDCQGFFLNAGYATSFMETL